MRTGDTDLNIQASGHGTPLVWAHGMMSSIAAEDALGWFEWDKLPDGLRLIRYDARGHGASAAASTAAGFQWKELGADMLSVASAADAPDLIAGGMSMGCATAIHAAVQSPERIRGLVLAMPPRIWENRAAQREMYQRIAERGIDADGRAMAKLMSRDMARCLPSWLRGAGAGQAAGLAIGIEAVERRTIPDLFLGAAQSDLPPPEALAALADIPALILGWSGDGMHPLASAQELHRLLPGSALHIASCLDEFRDFPRRIRAFAENLA